MPAGWSTHTTVALLFHAQGLSLRPRPCGSTWYGPFSLKSASSDEQPDHRHHHHHQPPLSQQASQPVSGESGTWMYERSAPLIELQQEQEAQAIPGPPESHTMSGSRSGWCRDSNSQ